MPRSKRAKVVHLSKVTKKGKELSLKTFANVQEACGQYAYAYVFAVDNMRNTYLKDVRAALSADSRLFFGKTKVMAKALGASSETAPQPGTDGLAKYMAGSVGLLFTGRAPEEVQQWFAGFRPMDFARSGTTATRGFVIPAGTVYSRGGEIAQEDDVPMAHSVEPTLRKLGVPSRLVKGTVELENEYVVCREGEVLGAGQTTLLKMFGIASAEFRVDLRAYWRREGGQVVEMSGRKDEVGAGGMEVDAGED